MISLYPTCKPLSTSGPLYPWVQNLWNFVQGTWTSKDFGVSGYPETYARRMPRDDCNDFISLFYSSTFPCLLLGGLQPPLYFYFKSYWVLFKWLINVISHLKNTADKKRCSGNEKDKIPRNKIQIVQNLCEETFKSLKDQDGISSSWVGRFNILVRSILPWSMYKFFVSLTEILLGYF